jgi:hypothetical protein
VTASVLEIGPIKLVLVLLNVLGVPLWLVVHRGFRTSRREQWRKRSRTDVRAYRGIRGGAYRGTRGARGEAN